MRNILTFIILALLLNSTTSAQDKEDEAIDEVLDELFMESDILMEEIIESLNEFKLLYVSLNYNTNTYFAGRDIGIDQYNLATQLGYVDSKGFSAGIAGIYYDQFDPGWDVTIASVGYGNYMGTLKTFRYQFGYTRFFYSDPNANPLKNLLDAGITAYNKKRNFGSQLTFSLLFGDTTSYQLTSRTFLNVPLKKGVKSRLSLRPQLIFNAGQQTIELSRSLTIDGVETETLVDDEVFDLINTQLILPIQYTVGDFDMEAGYIFNIPNSLGDEPNLDTTGLFTLSLTYLIDL